MYSNLNYIIYFNNCKVISIMGIYLNRIYPRKIRAYKE